MGELLYADSLLNLCPLPSPAKNTPYLPASLWD